MSSDVENSDAAKKGDKNSDKPTKKNKSVRHRKRKHFNEIREQMEFYFGDANLSKDRFIMKLIRENPYVPLEIFMSFNKMKKICSSVEEIAKSLTSSDILELDEGQKSVKRKTEIPQNRDVDSKTLYVESLPPTADHDWVKNLFSRFGTVSYVSLPKFTKSRKIKEFGFIEFDQEASIEKALKAFREFGGVLCTETADPGKLISVTSFLKEKDGEKDEETKEECKKRKKDVVDSEAPAAKRTKSDSDADRNESESAAVDTDTNEVEEDGKKRKRRRKKKSKQNDKTLSPDADLFELKVLPKKEWKRLRNKYLNLQREKISELKRLAWKNSHPTTHTTTASAPKKEKASKLENMNMNFYGANQEDNDENISSHGNDSTKQQKKKNPALEKPPLFNFEPGLIVSIKFLEPCVTVKEFKADMKQYEAVKYVDIKEGALEAYLRCDNAASAVDFVKQISCAEYNCKPVIGDAESEYWRKIMLDREMKLNKKVKLPLKRGREKVAKAISKHVRFGDDDEN